MKTALIIGIALIILGMVGMAIHGISYKAQENVVDIGDIQVTAETQKTSNIPVIAGGLAVVAGVVVVVVSMKKK